MGLKDKIPKMVYDAIVNFILTECSDAQRDSWLSSRKEEDSITGHFLGRFFKLYQRVDNWEWDLSFHKFGSRGRNATESIIGADGIFQIIVRDGEGNIIFVKSFLFQSKKEKLNTDLQEQLNKIEDFLPNSGCLIFYDEEKYKVMKARDYLNDSSKWKEKAIDFCDFLINVFFRCKAGLENLSINLKTEIITFQNEQIPIVVNRAIQLSIKRNGR